MTAALLEVCGVAARTDRMEHTQRPSPIYATAVAARPRCDDCHRLRDASRFKWNNPYRMDEGQGACVRPTRRFLLAYWLARHHEILRGWTRIESSCLFC